MPEHTPTSGESGMHHLPACRVASAAELARERGHADPERFAGLYIQKCADGCPLLDRTMARAREVARERGWLTDEGFIWETES
jgi:hypothetical protein